MSTFLERLITEEAELMDKIAKLNAFINGNNFKTIDPMQQTLLKIQVNAMHTYSQCLIERIELLK